MSGSEGELLRAGDRIRIESSGQTMVVAELLGAGGQGEVYSADLAGRPAAIKWYFPSVATPEQRRRLESLVRKGSPGDQFLWPLGLAVSSRTEGYGYVMPLRPQRFHSLTDYVEGKVDPTFGALTATGRNLAQAFLRLHAQGLCYRDISFGNIFFDPESGAVLVCDNDNVGVDGEASGDVLGTLRFMAPEVVRGEALPSSRTDLFSLAVLMFFLFALHHPLEGERELAITCFDLPAMVELYGTNPVFVFDPANETNRPVPGYHDNALAFWPILPRLLKSLFVRSFTSGISDPNSGRIRETEWRAALSRLQDSICYCQKCGVENFGEFEHFGDGSQAEQTCWSCSAPLLLPPILKFGHTLVCLNRNTRLYSHHVTRDRLYEFSEVHAAVNRHPSSADVWGLKNESPRLWTVRSPDGSVRVVEQGQSVTLRRGVRIDFGSQDATML
jgi:serine/threonine protein kinase